MRRLKLFMIIMTFTNLLILSHHDYVLAQGRWPSRADELPGYTNSELLTASFFLLGGVGLSFLIKKPKPELHIKGSDLPHNYNVERLQKFSRMYLVKQESPKRTDYGFIKSFLDNSLVIETRKDSMTVTYRNIKEIMDLESAAKRSKVKRIKIGLISLGGALGSYYFASVDESEKRWNWLSFASFSVLSAYSFLHKSGAEKEFEIWVEEYDSK